MKQRNMFWFMRQLTLLLLIGVIVGMSSPAAAQTFFSCSSVSEIPKSECEALVALYTSTAQDGWRNRLGWLVTTNPCRWHGVTCSDGSVTKLDLRNNNLSGSIPPELGNLSKLEYLFLQNNQLSGLLPAELSHLTALTVFWFSNTTLCISPDSAFQEWLAGISNVVHTRTICGTETFRFSCDSITEIPKSECEALVALYNSTNGDNWSYRKNWLVTTTSCSWHGVTCSDGSVIKLGLRNNNLSGSIPLELGNLENLQDLDLSRNQLSGSLPPELGNLSKLESLSLYDNQLSESLPDLGKLSKLGSLDLSENQLSGSLPPELSNLSKLGTLDLSENQLSGSLPPELGKLSNLGSLDLSKNQLSGSLPPELSKLSKLEDLDLSKNQLSGSLPPELGKLSNLGFLGLDNNQLSGPLPDTLLNLTLLNGFSYYTTDLCEPSDPGFQHWLDGKRGSPRRVCGTDTSTFSCDNVTEIPKSECEALVALYNNTGGDKWFNGMRDWLITNTPCNWYGVTCSGGFMIGLYLFGNGLSGSLPPELGNLSSLYMLHLSHNQLSGSLPPELGNLSKLEYLHLSYNQLSGSLPPELGNLSNLEYLYLQNNQLSGSLPPELGKLSKLEYLDLSRNQLSGNLPPDLGNLSKLEYLYLQNNQLSGSLPPELGNLSKLESLILHNNQLSGNLPPELGNLSKLRYFNLQDNQLSGSLPPELGNLSNLEYLILRNNQLSGSLPPELGNLSNLGYLILRNNQLSGSLPPELGNLSNLEYLILRNNQLSGSLPPELSHLSKLRYFELDNNQLSGPLPAELTQLGLGLANFYASNGLALANFSFSNTKLCEPPEPTFQDWLAGLSPLESTGTLCINLLLTLQSDKQIEDIETFLNDNYVEYSRLFDDTRGNAAVKEDLGISRSYFLEASPLANPNLLEDLRNLSEVEECTFNQILGYDQHSSILPDDFDILPDAQWELQKVETNYILTDYAFKDLEDHIPGHILERLKALESQTFPDQDTFLQAVKEQIGTDQTDEYKNFIVKHAEIDIPETWKVSRDTSEPVLIAVIDDFTSLLEQEPTESDLPPSHGVHVARIADPGIADLLFLNTAAKDRAYTTFAEVFRAIEYAVDKKLGNPDYAGAVINLSLSAPLTRLGPSEEERERERYITLFQRWIDYAFQSGVPIVTSMGNFNWDVAHYPAAFVETIAVGGTDQFYQRWFEQGTTLGSNAGTHLDLMTLAIDPDGTKTGTSMAAARVTRTMASLLDILALKHPEYAPEELHQELRWLLETTALDRVGDPNEDTPGHDPYYGRGVVDPDAAAACAEREQILVRPAAVDFGTVKIGDVSIFPVMLTNCYKAQTFVIDRMDFSITSTASEQIDSSEFKIVNHPVTHVLESGKTYTFDVRFTPQTTGQRSAALSSVLHSTSPENVTETLDVALRGTALGAEFSGLLAEPDVLDFGNVRVGGGSVIQATVTNFHQDSMTIQDITITDLDVNSGFQILGQHSGHVLDAGTSLTFKVQFEPQTSGLKHAFVSISTIGNPESYDLPLYGRALDRDASSEPDPYLPYQPDDEPISLDPAPLKAQADNLMRNGVELYNTFEYWKALEKFQQAHKLYRLAQYPRGEAQALTGIGLAYAGAGRFEDTLEVFLQARVIYQTLSDRLQEGIILNKTGIVYSRMGQYINALHTFHEVLKIEQELNRRWDEGRTLMNIGVVYLNQGWPQRATPYFEDALAIAREIQDIEGQGLTLFNLGSIHHREEHYQEALDAYQQALGFLQQLSKTEIEQGTLLLNIGDAYAIQAQYQDALKAFQHALTVFRGIHYDKGEITALRKIGDLSRTQGKYSAALSQYQQAIEICRQTNNSSAELEILKQFLEVYEEIDDEIQQAGTLSSMGEVYNRLRQYDDAIDVLMQAMLIQGSIENNRDFSSASAISVIGDEKGLSNTFMIAGEVFLRKGEYGKAIQLLDLALETQGAENGWVDEGRIHTNLGEAYLKQGQHEQAKEELNTAPNSGRRLMLLGEVLVAEKEYAEALMKLQQAVGIFEAAKSYEEQGRTLMDIGEVYFRQGKYSDARDNFQEALMSCRLAGELKGEAIALTRLGDLQQETEALEHYRHALELYRQLDDRGGQLDVLHRMLALQGDQSGDAAAIGLDLGKAYISRGEYDEAIATLDGLDSSNSRQAEKAEILLYLGIAYRLKQDYQNALFYLQQALALYPGADVSINKATILLNIGETLFRQALDSSLPNFDEAMAYYHEALAIYDAVGDLQGKGKTLMRIGDVYLKQENYNAAIESYNEAVTLLSQVDDHYNQVLALMNLGQAYDSAGLYWDALEAYKRALGIMHDTGNFLYGDFFHTSREVRRAAAIITTPDSPVNPADLYQRMATDYLRTEQNDEAADALQQAARSYDLQEDDDQALETYEQTREIQQENNDLEGEAETLRDMADLQQENGNTEEALELLEKTLDTQRENNDYAGQEETVSKIEEIAPYYTKSEPSSTERSEEEFPPARDDSGDNESQNSEWPQDKTPKTINAPDNNQPSPFDQPLAKSQDPTNTRAKYPDMGDWKVLSSPKMFETPQQRFDRFQRRAESLNNMGLVYLRQGNFRKAEKVFLFATRIQKNIGDTGGLAKTVNNRGLLRYMIGEYDKARELFEASLKMLPENERLVRATVLNHLALLLYRQGQEQHVENRYKSAEGLYGEAIIYFRTAQEITDEIGAVPTKGTILNNMGLVYYSLTRLYRNYGDQEGLQNRTLQAFAYYQKSLNAYQNALNAFEYTLFIVRAAGGRAGESATLHNIGKVYGSLGLDDLALGFFRQALAIERETGNRLDEARTLADIGYLYERQGTVLVSQAQKAFQQPGRFRERIANGFPYLLKGTYHLQKALEFYYVEAIDVYENLRTSAGIEAFKISFAEQTTDAYQRAILLLFMMDRKEEAFNLSEHARARAFLDQLETPRVNPRQGVGTQLLEAERVLQRELVNIEQTLEVLGKQYLYLPEKDWEKQEEINQQIKALTTKKEGKKKFHQELLTRIAVNRDKAVSLGSVNPLRLGQIQEQLPDDSTLISYFVTPEKTLAFVVTKQSLNILELTVREHELQQAAAVFEHPRAREIAELEIRLQQLYDWLVAPLKPYLNTPVVSIVPHGVLHSLPFAALMKDNAYFGDEYGLFTLPSGSALRFVQSRKQFLADEEFTGMSSQDSCRVAAIGYSPEGELHLDGPDEEVRKIQELFNTCGVTGDAATETWVKTNAADARILHISAHGILNRDSLVFFSHLLLKADEQNDGTLEIHEIYELDLPYTELVTLSACNSGVGSRSRGDDMVSLNRAFMYAGVPGVVASLWSVDDLTTRDFMDAFYTALQQGQSKAAALQQARQIIRAEKPHPYYWAAFVLTGDPGHLSSDVVTIAQSTTTD